MFIGKRFPTLREVTRPFCQKLLFNIFPNSIISSHCTQWLLPGIVGESSFLCLVKIEKSKAKNMTLSKNIKKACYSVSLV